MKSKILDWLCVALVLAVIFILSGFVGAVVGPWG